MKCWCPVLVKLGLFLFTACGAVVDGDDCSFDGGIVAEGSSIEDDCNRCTCRNGELSCTQTQCDPQEPEPSPEPGGCELDDGRLLDDGDSLMVDCNLCSCTDGLVLCTQVECAGDSCDFDGREIQSGASVVVDCNSCVCDDGTLSCTQRDCSDGNACEADGGVYQHGEEVPSALSCRTCQCDDGEVLCVSIGCPDGESCEYQGEVYADGEKFNDRCNECSCDDGTVSCTERACGVVCTVDGVMYEDRAMVPSDDRCESCQCFNGVVRCEATACPMLTCELDDTVYLVGDEVQAANPDCTECRCTEQGDVGAVVCENLGCSVEPECADADGLAVADGTIVQVGSLDCRCSLGQLDCPDPDGTCTARGQVYMPGEPVPDPNSCNTCVCEDGEIAGCTEASCPILQLETCDATATEPDFGHERVAIDNGYLTIDVTYSGGCGQHVFRLCYDPLSDGALPEGTLHLSHEGADDPCLSLVDESLVFDLYPLTEAGHDEVFLHLGEDSFLYRTP